MKITLAGGKLWRIITFSKPLTVRTGDTERLKDGVVEIVDKDGNVVESCTYSEEIFDDSY